MKKLILLLGIHFSAQATYHNLLESLTLEPHKISYTINKHLKQAYLTEDLFVEYDTDIDLTKLDYSIYTMPLVLNIISVIWISGESYTIDSMDKELYASLYTVKEVYKRLYPQTKWDGKLIPLKLVDNSTNSPQDNPTITIPFSHGLDSVCTSLIHHATPQLLLTARGMQDMALGQKEDHRWQQTLKLIAHFNRVHNHTSAFVYSNFHDFFNWKVLNSVSPEIKHWRLYAVEDLGWMGLAAPILRTYGYNKLMLVSNIGSRANHPGAGCPMVVNNVHLAGISCKMDSFEKSRLEKNQAIADICNNEQIEKPLTLVCSEWLTQRKNCCRCQKCCITMISFLVIGEDPKEYGFDRDLTDFFHYYRNVYYFKNKYSVYRAWWNKDCQEMARTRLHLMTPEMQEFFTWYTAIDFDRLCLPTHNMTIDYKDFADLFKGDPQKPLTPGTAW